MRLTDDQLCNDKPCTCGAAIHDPVLLFRTGQVFRRVHDRRMAKKNRTEEK